MKFLRFKNNKLVEEKMSKSSDEKLELKMFVAKIRSMKIDMCECKKCISYLRSLYSLVHKIMATINVDDYKGDACTWTDIERNKVLDLIEVNIGASIVNPDYLYVNLCQVNSPELHRNKIKMNEYNFVSEVKRIIESYWELLTDEELDEFGDAIVFISYMYIPMICKNYIAVSKQ